MAKLSAEEQIKKVLSDFRLFAKNFIKIVDNSGNVVPFELNEQQQEFIDGMQKFNIISKSRQLGFTTMSLGLCLYYAVTKPNTNYLILSYKGDSAKDLFEKLKFMNNNLPRKKFKNIFPSTRRDNRDELLLSNGSRIVSTTVGNKDVGRGSTYQYILLSEMAFYSNQEKILLSAEQALAKNEESRIVIETTSNGFNYYQKLFNSAWKGQSKYKATFYPFFSSAYRKQFKTEHDEAEKWHKEYYGYRLSEKDLEQEEKMLHKLGANFRFLMWRRWKLMDMEKNEFMQEFPATPAESFISTGNSVFEQSKILERMNHLIEPLSKNEVLRDSDFPKILKQYLGKSLFLFHLPKRNKRYYAGVDVASGGGADYSTISIFDSDGQQVASFYNNKIPIYKFAEVVDAIGRFYNYAFLTIERNSYGLPLIERVREQYNYMNMYKQKTFDQRGKRKMQLGFMTTVATKAILISDFKENFETGLINIECQETLEQMQIYVETDGKMGNKKGEKNHDDLVISAALAVQGMKANKWYV